MASKADLLASARKRVQKQKIFRRGRGTNTGVRQASASPDAGRGAKEVSDFLGTLLNIGPGILDAHNKETNEENKKLVAKGEATYKNATPEQRRQFKEAIRSGAISGGESPYFREGLKRAQADAMALEYGNEVMLAWEQSDAKNSSDPQAFTNFLDEFQHKADGPPGQNRSWEERVGDLGEHVANEEFQPRADAIKRQLMQMHSEYQRSEYKKKAQDLVESSEGKKFEDPTISNLLQSGDVDGTLAKEGLITSSVTRRLNMLDPSKRVPLDTSAKSKFIQNYINKSDDPRAPLAVHDKTAENEYNRQVGNIEASLEHHITKVIGKDGAKNVFSLAAFKKESKKDRSYIASTSSKGDTKYTKSPHPTELELTPIENAQESMLDIASFIEPDINEGVVAMSPPPAEVPPPIDEPEPTSIVLASREIGGKDFSNKQIVIAEGELEYIDREPDQVEDVPVSQPIESLATKPTQIEDAMKLAIEGIDPAKTSYGLVAYNTEEEAQKIVDNIRDNVVGDTTGTWEFAIKKVGDVYQVQTQGGSTITDNQHKAFFDALASEYPGEMGNLNARWDDKVKDKDYVQVISPARIKPKKKKRT